MQDSAVFFAGHGSVVSRIQHIGIATGEILPQSAILFFINCLPMFVVPNAEPKLLFSIIMHSYSYFHLGNSEEGYIVWLLRHLVSLRRHADLRAVSSIRHSSSEQFQFLIDWGKW